MAQCHPVRWVTCPPDECRLPELPQDGTVPVGGIELTNTLQTLASYLQTHGFYAEAHEEMMELITLQAERIIVLEDEVERLGGMTVRELADLKQAKPADREIVPDYIND